MSDKGNNFVLQHIQLKGIYGILYKITHCVMPKLYLVFFGIMDMNQSTNAQINKKCYGNIQNKGTAKEGESPDQILFSSNQI